MHDSSGDLRYLSLNDWDSTWFNWARTEFNHQEWDFEQQHPGLSMDNWGKRKKLRVSFFANLRLILCPILIVAAEAANEAIRKYRVILYILYMGLSENRVYSQWNSHLETG